MWANDELFAERENLINAAAPSFAAHTFGPKGQIMDGWESRRRRADGQDEAIIRLGAAGIVRGIVVDTSHFTGNYPPEVSIEACGAERYPDGPALYKNEWSTLVARSAIAGDARNDFPVDDAHRYTHVKLTMYPDGGVARLRVHGEVVPDPRLLPAVFDLAALENGGRVITASNMFYSAPGNLIMPGNARAMGDGWETSRRRDDGNDWAELSLACESVIALAELDTSYFVGNAPGWGRLTTADGRELLPRTALLPDTRHRFVLPASGPTDQVRLDIYPDGGMARLRLLGTPTEAGRATLAQRFLTTLPEGQRQSIGDDPGQLDSLLRGPGLS
jgi:allantoicase